MSLSPKQITGLYKSRLFSEKAVEADKNGDVVSAINYYSRAVQELKSIDSGLLLLPPH